MAEVIPISLLQVDWQAVKSLPVYLGRSPMRGLDSSGMKVESHASYLAILDALASRDSQPVRALRQNRALGNHLFFGFIVISEADILIQISLYSELSVCLADTKELAVVSGTLSQWRDGIVRLCAPHVNPELRIIFNQVYLLLTQAGLKEFFYDLKRQDLKDGTFTV